MVAHGDHLFVAAGNTNAGDRRDVMTTEMYDIGCDSWTTLTPSLHGQSEAPAVQCDGRIYILGGYSWDAHSFQVTHNPSLVPVVICFYNATPHTLCSFETMTESLPF